MTSEDKVIIALDAMGGDHAPHTVLSGANIACQKEKNVEFLLFGNEQLLAELLPHYPHLQGCASIRHAATVIAADEKPSNALRQGKESSMRLAIDAVKAKAADAIISAGNTGALMATAKIVLKTLPCIDRPAIVAVLPSLQGPIAMLDLGANAECSANNLVEFAIMGDAFARATLAIAEPRVGLLNIGSEDAKGNDTVRTAAMILREGNTPINFIGYIEGNDIAEGKAHVVVTDGFSGNIALKTAEGTAKISKVFLKEGFNRNWLAKLGGFLARPSLKKAFNKLDHRLYNGAMLVGLNGVVVKSHGSADDIAFANAIHVAAELVKNKVNVQISEEIASIHE